MTLKIPADLSTKSDSEIDTWILNHENKDATDTEFYRALLEERAKRVQAKQHLNLETSMRMLRSAAINKACVTYGEIAAASGVPWSRARHQMNGPKGHLALLLDICFARRLPLLPALCVNQRGMATGDLEDNALQGFVLGAQRLGIAVPDGRTFHRQCRDDCWQWGKTQVE
jgi:hypothetical protein